MTCPICSGPTIESAFGYECTNKLYGRCCTAQNVVVLDKMGKPIPPTPLDDSEGFNMMCEDDFWDDD